MTSEEESPRCGQSVHAVAESAPEATVKVIWSESFTGGPKPGVICKNCAENLKNYCTLVEICDD